MSTRLWYSLIIFFCLFPLFYIFSTTDLFHSHDGLVHLPRIAAYFKALSDFQIPLRWAGDLNYGYGLPLFNFIYHTPYLVASFFLFLGVNLVTSFKLSLALSYILSGVFMFGFARAFFKDDKKAFMVAIFYQFAPFRFVELLVRASFGEVYTYTFLPLVLWQLTLLFRHRSYITFLLTSLSTFLLILSHNAVSLLFFGLCALFTAFFSKSRKNFLLGAGALVTGLLLASFYWIPAIAEHKYTYGDLFMKDLFHSHFFPVQNFFLPTFFSPIPRYTEGISLQIGLFHLLGLLLGVLSLFMSKTAFFTKKFIIFSLVLVISAFFFMGSFSSFVWEHVALFRQFQFPWRFLSIVVFATSLSAVSLFSYSFFRKRIIYALLVGLVILSTVFYWRPSLGYDKINESYYWNFPLNTTYYGETDLIWSAGPAKSYPKNRVEAISGKATIKNFQKKSNLHTFQVTAGENVALVDHTQYFPGWKVYVDNAAVPIQFQDPNWRGLITFPVAQGSHNVKVVFSESPVRKIADAISLLSLIGLLSVFILLKLKFK